MRKNSILLRSAYKIESYVIIRNYVHATNNVSMVQSLVSSCFMYFEMEYLFVKNFYKDYSAFQLFPELVDKHESTIFSNGLIEKFKNLSQFWTY